MEPTRPLPASRRDPRLVALAEDSGYEILGRIGSGGMGIVYRGRDADGNDVAVKLLRHEISDDQRARDRLSREVAAQRLVRNENIARILDAELDSPDAFVVTEFVPGPTLEDAVRAHGGLHPEAVREIGVVLGHALRAIHEAGVIHRDLKPSNVLLRGAAQEDLAGFDPEGDRLDPVIIDFGIAQAAEESRLTSTGLVMGTAAYLDPEVVRTNQAAEAGDWWAWAAMLAFAATGREPYGTGRADLVFLRAERGEIDVDGVPVELGDWLRSALQADPAQRPEPSVLIAQLGELDLERYEDPGPTEALGAGATAALDAGSAGAAAALPASGATPASPSQASPSQAGPSQVGPDGTPGEMPTEALPALGEATAALPVVDGPGREGRGGRDGTEADRGAASPAEPATEVLPTMGPPTKAMPAIREEIPSRQDHPVRRGTPQQLGGPPQVAPQIPLQQAQSAQAQPAPQQAQLVPQQAPTFQQPMPGQQLAPGQQVAGGQMMPAGPWGVPAPPPPRRPLQVWLGHLLIIGLAAVAPYVSVVALLLLGALARTWETSHRAVAARRGRGAESSGPLWAAGFASPFRFALGLLVTALQMLLPLVLGALVGIAADVVLTMTLSAPPPSAVAYGTAVTITLLITWVGIGSRTTRQGAHRMVDAAAPNSLWTVVLTGLLLLLVVVVAVTVMARGGAVDYFPFPDWPRLEQIGLWRD